MEAVNQTLSLFSHVVISHVELILPGFQLLQELDVGTAKRIHLLL